MKKRFLALLTVLLLAALMTTAVCGATSLVLATAGEGVDYTALTEAKTFDVYIVVSPMTVASGTNYIYRVPEDSTDGAPSATKNKLSNEKFTLTWDKNSLEVSTVEYFTWDEVSTGDKLKTDWVVGDGYKLAFLAKTNLNNELAIFDGATVTGVGTGTLNTGTLVIDYGDTTVGGFMIREETSVPNAAVAKVTFTVVSGAEGGVETITLDNSYKVGGTSYSAAQTSVSVTVVAGCKHESKSALSDPALASKGYENAQPTCMGTGNKWYHCSDCDSDVNVTINKLDHSYTVFGYVKAPNCYEGGQSAMFCSTENCTAYDADTVADVGALGHSCTERVYLAPTCTEDGYEYYWCTRCKGIAPEMNATSPVSGAYYVDGKLCTSSAGTTELTEIPVEVAIAKLGHDWVYDRTEEGVQYYYCSRNAVCGGATTVSLADTVRYAANEAKGTGDGSSAANATTYSKAFEDFGNLPAGVEATIYLTETINLAPLQVSSNNTITKSYEESRHEATVTVTTAEGVSKAALYFDFATVSQYHLYGPTVFDNIIISSNAKGGTSGNSESISIFARGFRFETTENLEMASTLSGDAAKITYSKENGDFIYATRLSHDFAACKVYLMGGFYPGALYEGTNGKTYTSNLIINGGEFYVVTGGGRDNSGLPIVDSELNVHIGGNAVIGQLAPVSIFGSAFSISGTVVNLHYHGGTVLVAYRGEMQPRYSDQYTVNHFFHDGCGSMKVGDFQMGNGSHAKNVNCYYSVSDTASPSAKDYGLAFIAKGNLISSTGETYSEKYLETNENMSFPEYCIEYLGGHDVVGGKCSFCKITPCTSHRSEYYVASEATCIQDGVSYDRCSVCFEKLSDIIYIPKSDDYHDIEFVVEIEPTCLVDGKSYYKCTICREKIGDDIITEAGSDYHNASWRLTNADAYEYYCSICKKVLATRPTNVTEFYVSDNGKPDGGFTPDYPLNDFALAMQMAAKVSGDATVYVVGTITVPHNYKGSSSNTVFSEPAHENLITVKGYKNVGTLKLQADKGRMLYALNGDTTFENVELSSRGYTATANDLITYFAAQHHHLTFGENVSTDFMRNTNQSRIPGSYFILGGCYHYKYGESSAVKAATCTGGDNHITIHSGTFHKFVGGSIGGNCSNSDVTVEILGDVTFRDYFVFGGYEYTSGDVLFTLDGNLSVGYFMSFAGVNKNAKYTDDGVVKFDTTRINCANVGDVTLKILDGSIFTQSFYVASDAVLLLPLGASRYGVMENVDDTEQDYEITRHVDSLTIIYDPASGSAKETALRFKPILTADSKGISYKTLDSDNVCPSAANGEHTQGAEVERVASECSAQGYVIYECTVCHGNYSESLAAVPHTFGDGVTVTAANCTNPEIEKKVCECGYTEFYIGDESATGVHVYDENNVCTGCMQSKQTLCAHENWSAPEEIKTGCGVGTKTVCADCGKEVIEVTGADHNFGKYTVTVAPTETEPGIKTRSCRLCGKTETAVIYAEGGAINSTAIATDANGNLADLDVATSKLTSAEREVLNALLQDTSYGSEVKVSYKVDGDNITDITYSIPLPAEYAALKNVKVVVKDDNGTLHTVEFTVEKGFIVFKF